MKSACSPMIAMMLTSLAFMMTWSHVMPSDVIKMSSYDSKNSAIRKLLGVDWTDKDRETKCLWQMEPCSPYGTRCCQDMKCANSFGGYCIFFSQGEECYCVPKEYGHRLG